MPRYANWVIAAVRRAVEDRDDAKFKQTKDLVEYKFGENLQAEFNYCKQKYGIKFWETLYAQVAQ